jgi:hypothetical protein
MYIFLTCKSPPSKVRLKDRYNSSPFKSHNGRLLLRAFCLITTLSNRLSMLYTGYPHPREKEGIPATLLGTLLGLLSHALRMAVNEACPPPPPPNIERKRFKPLLTSSQPRSHDKKVENTAWSSQSVQTVRIHNGSTTAKTMRSPPKSNERKVQVPPARSSPTQTMGTRPNM